MCALLARVAQAVPATHKCKTISYTSSCTVALLYFVHYTVTNVRVLCMPKILSTWPILTLTGVLMDSLHTYIVCGGTYSLYFLRRAMARHWAAVLSTCTTGGSSAACACCLTIASICLHAITGAVDRAWRRLRLSGHTTCRKPAVTSSSYLC